MNTVNVSVNMDCKHEHVSVSHHQTQMKPDNSALSCAIVCISIIASPQKIVTGYQ